MDSSTTYQKRALLALEIVRGVASAALLQGKMCYVMCDPLMYPCSNLVILREICNDLFSSIAASGSVTRLGVVALDSALVDVSKKMDSIPYCHWNLDDILNAMEEGVTVRILLQVHSKRVQQWIERGGVLIQVPLSTPIDIDSGAETESTSPTPDRIEEADSDTETQIIDPVSDPIRTGLLTLLSIVLTRE